MLPDLESGWAGWAFLEGTTVVEVSGSRVQDQQLTRISKTTKKHVASNESLEFLPTTTITSLEVKIVFFTHELKSFRYRSVYF